jgi:hypothetical protein
MRMNSSFFAIIVVSRPKEVAVGAEEPKRDNSNHMKEVIAKATEVAKAKHTRLRTLKERNENYLAERKEEEDGDDDKTKEL